LKYHPENDGQGSLQATRDDGQDNCKYESASMPPSGKGKEVLRAALGLPVSPALIARLVEPLPHRGFEGDFVEIP
jgi:hypothetical protein